MTTSHPAGLALAQQLRTHNFKESQIEQVLARASFQCFRAGEEVSQKGPEGTVFCFVHTGCACFYALSRDGKKWTRYLAQPTEFITCLNAILPVKTRPEIIECLSDCELITISRQAYDELCQQPRMEVQIQKVIIDVLVNLARERSELLQMTATERYGYFLENYPVVKPHIKLGDVASYIGIRQQSLSRIRRQLRENDK